jgi:MoaA/NifB/PqqE/SkfB family radical SAM enzyme
MSFFCSLPFTEIQSNGSVVKPCCVFRKNTEVELDKYFDDPEMLSVKQQLLDGQAPTQCSTCVEAERVSGHSFRILSEKFHPELSADIKQKNDPTYHNIKSVSIRTSNICNLKCLPCHGQSFVRDTELKKLNLITLEPKLRQNSKWDEFIKLDFDKLTLLGGEPFYDRVTFQLLEELVRAGKSKNIQVDLNTNMTAITADKMNFLVNNFQKIMIKASIDGVGPVHHYLRYPSDWKTIQDNVQLVKQFDNVDIIVTSALSNLALIKFYELIDWVANNNFNLFLTPVNNPSVLHHSLLPPQLKAQLLEIYQAQKARLSGKIWDRTEHAIDTCITICSDTANDHAEWDNFIEWISRHDQLRQLSLTQTFPELVDYV